LRLAMLGPPGAGKGTQARLLAHELNIPQISTGDLLRDAVRRHTPSGTEAKRYMERGLLVPDELVLKTVSERMSEKDAAEGFILDGFPRTRAQAVALDEMLASKGQNLSRVLVLEISDEEIVKRITGRRVCKNCGAMYHVIFDPPRNAELCNECNGELYQREDDNEDTVRMRLEQYAAEITPLLQYYDKKGILLRIDGAGPVGDVHRRMLEALKEAAKLA
jgi:adenylate kinase